MASSRLAPLTQFITGRYICQLQRLTLQYCAIGGSSRGLRGYINDKVTSFASKNPQVVVYVRKRPYMHPRVVAEYLNGKSKVVSVKNLTKNEIVEKIELLRDSSGIHRTKMKRWWHTDSPSIQGLWNPFMNLPYKK